MVDFLRNFSWLILFTLEVFFARNLLRGNRRRNHFLFLFLMNHLLDYDLHIVSYSEGSFQKIKVLYPRHHKTLASVAFTVDQLEQKP